MVLPRYPASAANLWRWVDATEQDEAISTFLNGVLPIGPRPRLTDRDHTALMVYAQRCALATVRSRNGEPVVRAFQALALVKMDKVDEDRLLACAELVAHASERLSEAQRATVTFTVLQMEEDVAGILANEVDLEEAGYREMDTSAGRVFLEDEGAVFEPAADLVAAAYAVAAMLEADGYEAETVGIGQTLHPAWLKKAKTSARAAAATASLTGCVHVHAVRGLDDVGVYLAEAPTDADAEAIGSAADAADSPEHPQIGVWAGRLFAFIYAGTLDPATPIQENKSTLDRFRAPLLDVLSGPA
jgi:hypothetical protein